MTKKDGEEKMNTLKTIQTLSKIGRILSKIVYICCVVGFCVCIVGIISLGLGGEVFKLGGVTIHSIIESHSHMSMPALYTAMAVGIVLCAAEAVLSKFAEVYFKNELKDGTPFTMRGAKELMRLGILTITIPLGMVIVCSIGVAIADNFFPEIETLSYDEYASVGLGVMMIVSSLFCRYGAEVCDGKASLKNIEHEEG